MKTKFLTAVILLTTIIACNKDKFQTKPTLEIKSLNTKEVIAGERLEIRMDFTDKEGDLDSLIYIRVRTNLLPIPNPNTYDKTDTVRSRIPDFPDNTSGEITVEIPYDIMDEDPNRNDTMYFRITILDNKKNSSDTVSTASVVARQN